MSAILTCLEWYLDTPLAATALSPDRHGPPGRNHLQRGRFSLTPQASSVAQAAGFPQENHRPRKQQLCVGPDFLTLLLLQHTKGRLYPLSRALACRKHGSKKKKKHKNFFLHCRVRTPVFFSFRNLFLD